MRYSPLMSLEGMAYPIVTLSLWVSLFIELKSFKIALVYATLSVGRKDTSKLSSLRTTMFLPFPSAGAAGWCWFAGWFWCCWLLGGLRAAGGWLAACTYKHRTSICMLSLHRNSIIQHANCKHAMSQSIIILSYTCLRSIVFWQSPIVIQGISKKTHCHEMPLLNVDDPIFDLNSYGCWWQRSPFRKPPQNQPAFGGTCWNHLQTQRKE